MKIAKYLVAFGAAFALLGCASNQPNTATQNEAVDAATLALLCADVLDMQRMQPNDLDPAPPEWTHFHPNKLGGKWEIVGYLSADDEIEVLGRIPTSGSKRVMYGVLAYETGKPDRYVVAIRGTLRSIEWVKDIEFGRTDTAWGEGVMAHQGFYSIYDSMRYHPKGGKAEEQPAWKGILAAARNKQLIVTGHSLGSPLAIYLTLDLASERQDVVGRYFASPRPGNSDFSNEVSRKISNYVVYNNDHDIVPTLPPSFFGFFYRALDNIRDLAPINDEVQITDDIRCHHHAVSYAAILQPAMMPMEGWRERLRNNQDAETCIAKRDGAGNGS
jgi:triacylglycerol lipase